MSDAVDETLALAARLPGDAIRGVFARYGKPLELPDDDTAGPRITIALPDAALAAAEPSDAEPPAAATATLRLVRFRAPVDVIANDWFVLDAPGAESLAMPGPLFAAAVAALTRVRERSSPT